MTVIRYLALELGLTVRALAMLAVTLAAFTAAMVLDEVALYGVAVTAATLAGATWQRHIICDDCHTRLDMDA